MIKSFKDKDLECLWNSGMSMKIRKDLVRRVLMKLELLDAATCIEDINNPPSNKLHKLRGTLKEFWSISVNGSWRLIFTMNNSDIYDVALLQYH